MGEKEERGIVNITKRSKDADDDEGRAGSWQVGRERGEEQSGESCRLEELLHNFVFGEGGGVSTSDFHPGWRSPDLPCSERRKGRW